MLSYYSVDKQPSGLIVDIVVTDVIELEVANVEGDSCPVTTFRVYDYGPSDSQLVLHCVLYSSSRKCMRINSLTFAFPIHRIYEKKLISLS